MSSELLWKTATEIATLVNARSVSAVEVTRAHLERIHAEDGKVGSFLRVDDAGALAQAAAVDDKLGRGDPVGPLAGVPVGLKDLFVTKGVETTAASKILAGWIPPYDCTHSVRLQAAGAVILGKLNMDEFAMGSSNENSGYHKCRNPWDTDRVPGGSSGGSAAAVAAGFCPITLGSDTGGSIRQPASLCGVVGIKPTYGRVSRFGMVAFASSLDQAGPLARTAEDCALALGVIAGHDPRDATSLAAPVPSYVGELSAPMAGLRVGVPPDIGGYGPVVDRFRAALARLVELGATLVDVELPHAQHALAAYYLIAPAEASSNLARYDGIRYGLRVEGSSLIDTYDQTRAAGFGAEVKRRILLGTFALRAGYAEAYYQRAQKVRALIKRDYDHAFEACDVIATPTSPLLAFPLGAKSDDPLAMYLADIYTIPCNLAGLPGLSVPIGFDRDQVGDTDVELPVGLQLVGRPLEEGRLLSAAAAYQRATDWHTRRPTLQAGGAA